MYHILNPPEVYNKLWHEDLLVLWVFQSLNIEGSNSRRKINLILLASMVIEVELVDFGPTIWNPWKYFSLDWILQCGNVSSPLHGWKVATYHEWEVSFNSHEQALRFVHLFVVASPHGTFESVLFSNPLKKLGVQTNSDVGSKVKDIKSKNTKVKMLIGYDLDVFEISEELEKLVVGHFNGKFMCSKSQKGKWEVWLGYAHYFFHFISFECNCQLHLPIVR